MPEPHWGGLALCAALLAGCAGDKNDLSYIDDTGPSGDTADPAGPADEDVLREAIAGDRDAADAMARVAASGGLPVETDDGTFLFACLCGEGTWYLSGDHNGWGTDELARAGDLVWIEASISEPDGSLYKFTDGGETWLSDPLGRRYGFDDFGEYSLVLASTPHLERWYAISAYDLAERDLQVWVPQDGVFTHLLFAHDGQNLFDPNAFWGGWRLSESVPDDMLVVGIDNTADRMDEYTHTTDDIYGDTYGGRGDDYAALVEEVIRPLMVDAYGDAEVTGLMGSSLGGLISLYIAHVYEGRYDMALSLSGTMGWGSIGADNPTMIDLYTEMGHRDTALYLDSGGGGTCTDSDGDGIDDDGDDSDNYCVNRQLADVLATNGYAWEEDLFHWWEPDAEHNEAAWADRVELPLSVFAAR